MSSSLFTACYRHSDDDKAAMAHGQHCQCVPGHAVTITQIQSGCPEAVCSVIVLQSSSFIMDNSVSCDFVGL